MSEQNYDQVICPECNLQFTAIPVNVQERIAELEQQLTALREANRLLHGELAALLEAEK